ncbi:tRNA (adenosine(37)-N6)-threonylcarbamoyltransferase complex ATPase subunit type 1 TsaE [SAR86 cluster bacterium]|jgi:tRNA threonylcarbamoyladenosine biosynthesis protein TsaE|nr:tRNA (adenosine(37)-N6)-threonylcarbamoyltransferase complex ATPase subunit type 1 TsaE [SAR86 cluster bacterium]
MNFNKKIILNSLDDTADIAKEIASKLEKYPKNKASIIFLEGDLGTGKTTLVKEILKSLGLSEPVTSPTFTIIEPYLIKDKKIYHIDLYRIESRKELEVLGIEEYSAENDCLIFIEWPEKAEGFFSEYDLKIRLSHINEFSRELIIEKS